MTKEKKKELEDFGARMYDPAIARWWSVDPMAEKFSFLTPFNAMGNNPTVNIDPDGKYFFKLFGSTSEQRRSARDYQKVHGGTIKKVWSEDISVEKQSVQYGMEYHPHYSGWAYTSNVVLEKTGFEYHTGIPTKQAVNGGLKIDSGRIELDGKTVYNDDWLQGSSTPSMTGREGLREYADDLGVAGLVLESSGVLAPVGQGLSISGIAINTYLDVTDPKVASERKVANACIRLVNLFLPISTPYKPMGSVIENELTTTETNE